MIRTAGLAIAVIIAALALTGTSATRAADEPFEIYVDLPLTGYAAFVGQHTAIGLHAVERYVNDNGGINGRPIDIVIRDDQSNPQVAVQNVSLFMSKKPAIVFGGSPASSCNAPAALVKDNGPVFWCYTPGVYPPPGSFVYSTGYSGVDLFTVGVRYFRERGMTKVAILSTTDASGQESGPAIARILALPENRSVTLTAHEVFGVSDISVIPQLERIQSSGAQMLIVWATGTPFATVLRGLRDSGIDLPVLSSEGNMIVAQLEGYASIWPSGSVYFPGVPVLVPDSVTNRGVRGAINRYLLAMKAENVTQPDIGEINPWDNMLIAVDAYRHLGVDATPAQMRDYINGVRNWQSIYGVMNFDKAPQRGVLPEWCMMVRWDPAKNAFVAVSRPGGAPLK